MANFYDLKHYIAHYINKGRCLVSEKGKITTFSERVYDRRGNYSEQFNHFIDRLLESGEFFHLYVEGDGYAFSDLIHSRFDLEYCVRCREPIPVPTNGALGPPACYLCPEFEPQQEAQVS
ncbi:MAG: hypothetical protein KME03_10215 [Aphanocapsa lilacina HA4352-LM1]|jgi:hypothetical protein|nr:hypothetical protein [Gloeobacter violaceus]MBW4698247.1 hypothetical protein [Aphanocapsa lilacina HA4352-LM1]